MLTRRNVLLGAGALSFGVLGLSSYACAIEPGFMLAVKRYHLKPAGWTPGLNLKIGILTDIHACKPWMPPERLRNIAIALNEMKPDMIVLLGDFNGGVRKAAAPVLPMEWAEAFSVLSAPLGVHAVLGNHDWWHGPLPYMPSDNTKGIREALKSINAPLYENDARRLEKNGRPFWVVGLGDQTAFLKRGSPYYRPHAPGLDDLPGALAKVSDDAPVVLLAHEPDIFDQVPGRVAVTLAGHTHGGQVRLPFGGSAMLQRHLHINYIYGHYQNDEGSHLIVSAGLGTSIVPVRFGCPPEIVEVTLSAPEPAVS